MEFEITDKLNPKDEKIIYDGLLEYNLPKMNYVKPKELAVLIRDDDDNIIGGLTGYTFGKWLIIKYLWISEAIRNKGFGSKLLLAAEDEALKRGAVYSIVDTFDFQAPLFYQKYGYKEVLTLEDYPVSGKRYYFTKEL